MDPLDSETPALSRSSLERINQLRERPLAAAPAPSRPVLPWVLVAVLLAFALGLIANPMFESSVRRHLPGFAETAAPTRADLSAAEAQVKALERRIAVLEARPATAATPAQAMASAEAGTLATRIGTTNARVDAIGTQVAMLAARVDAAATATQAAIAGVTHDAEAAQSVLLLAVTRRAIERGERLSVAVPSAEPALQSRFGAAHAAPLAAVLALGNAPVTPRSLARDLAALAPRLTGTVAAADASWWDTLTTSLSSIVRVRDAAGDPVDRIATAQAALALGNIDGALAEVAALPADKRRLASGWIGNATRLRAGLRGLAVLESAALTPSAVVPVVAPPVVVAPPPARAGQAG